MIWNKVDTRNLVYCTDWESAESSVRAKTFGVMVELAKDRVKFYQGDLYHDARWISDYVTGPMQFDWACRESGTHIGTDVTSYFKVDEWADAVLYRFEILNNDGKWMLNIYEAGPLAPLPSVPEAVDEDHELWGDVSCTGYKGIYGIQHDSDTCPVHEDVPLEARKVEVKFELTTEENKKEILDYLFNPPRPAIFPTPRNEEPIRKVNNMYDLINDLREKLEAAQSSRDELQEAKYDIDSAIDDLDTYISDLDDLIGQLDSLPEVSVSVSVDVDFES